MKNTQFIFALIIAVLIVLSTSRKRIKKRVLSGRDNALKENIESIGKYFELNNNKYILFRFFLYNTVSVYEKKGEAKESELGIVKAIYFSEFMVHEDWVEGVVQDKLLL